jgi:hypothetical protein
MQMIDDIKLGFRCERVLEYVADYKKKADADPRYYLAYLQYRRTYNELKSQIKHESIKHMLTGLERLM